MVGYTRTVPENVNVPGVFIDESSSQPPPIVDQPTAIPAFIGCTAQAISDTGESLLLTPTRISSLLDYERLFGGPAVEPVSVALRTNRQRAGGVEVMGVHPPTGTPPHLLAWSVRHYFDNGGSECIIVSIGDYSSEPDAGSLMSGLAAAENDTSITLLMAPDAATLPTWSAFRDVTTAMLAQCGRLERRFAVLDVWRGDVALSSTVDLASAGEPSRPVRVIEASRSAWTNDFSRGAAYYPFLQTPYPRFRVTPDDSVTITLDGQGTLTLDQLQASAPQRADVVRKALNDVCVVVPPSGAVAGVYAQTDAMRGVWKAPANASLNSVVRPMASITDAQQQGLNLDVAGKSVNAIRTFAGKGTLVWGARTLAGNDNEWRYVNVRRFVDSIQRSILASTQWVTFEPNDSSTWTRLSAAVENYLTLLWRQGALQGPKPEDAFWVRCGLGQTMTTDDVANGMLRLTIALAPLRPAEFQLVGITYAVSES